MVINEVMMEVTDADQFNSHSKKHKTKKHHVRDTTEQNQIENTIPASSESEKETVKRKSDKKRKKQLSTSKQDTTEDVEPTKISENDLEELRTVYNNCKVVMNKIEYKYGHLLNIPQEKRKKRKKQSSDSETSDAIKCECSANKKTVFDDEGKEVTTVMELGNHICVKKAKRTISTDYVNNILVEYEGIDTTLPDDLLTLTNILHDPEIKTTYRNNVIKKIRLLKQGLIDEIRFNKPALIEKIKLNPDEILDFKGTNLKSLPGYSVS